MTPMDERIARLLRPYRIGERVRAIETIVYGTGEEIPEGMDSLLGTSGPDQCQYCSRAGMTIYTRDNVPFGCTACLSAFFDSLPPTKRPWRMSAWDDLKSLFRRI